MKYWIIIVGCLLMGACSDTIETDGMEPEGTIQLGLSVGTSSKHKTRQSAAVTQADGTITSFRGLTELTLYPFSCLADQITSSSTPVRLHLKSATSLTSKDLLLNSKSHLYSDLEIPVTTKSVAVYAKAIGEGTDHAGRQQYGALNVSGVTTASALDHITASLVPLPDETTESNAVAAKLATYLSNIANGTGWSATTNAALKKLYDNFIQMKSGSSEKVQAAVRSLYRNLNLLATPAEGTEAFTSIKTAIIGEITASGYATLSGSTLTFDSSLDGYPAYHPDGAAQVEWNSDHFEAQPINTIGTGISYVGNTYYYPPALRYFGTTNVKTSKDLLTEYYDDVNSWESILAEYDGDEVVDGTHSIALVSPLQYGMGLMKLEIRINNSSNTLQDRLEASIDFLSGMKLTGVLIDNQYDTDWKFQPQETSVPKTVYDSKVSAMVNCEAFHGDYVYTLVMESNASQPVPIALEFENSSMNFVGYDDQVIPAGGKFYLIGTIDNSGDAYADQEYKVFRRGWATPVQMTIESLKNAYSTIPDLRSPQVQQGLTVNTDWQSGISKDHTF